MRPEVLSRDVGQEEETTKSAKDAKMGERIVFREKSYRINFGREPKIEHERFVNQLFSRVSRIS